MSATEYDYIESEDLYEMALAWIEQGKLDEAKSCIEKSIDLNPNFIYAYVTLAEVLAMKKQYGNAVQVLKKASKRDPEFHRLNYIMAKYAYRGGDIPSAKRYIDMAIEISPEPLYLRVRNVIIRG
ncbi:MAG TPA: tetratricopeptide repeat protein [Spirochaetota bacterium]|nr:tetratricopeptide repeat protein [Spirochaetota bacterium]